MRKSQRSDSKPYPQKAGYLKDQERFLFSDMLDLDLSQTSQDKELTCRWICLINTCGGEARYQWLDTSQMEWQGTTGQQEAVQPLNHGMLKL